MNESKNPIHAVIFDMDGTLTDTEKVYRRNWIQAGKAVRFDGIETALSEITGRNLPDTRRLFAEKYTDVDFDALLELREKMYEADIAANGVPLKPGAREVVAALHDAGIRLAIGTSTYPERTRYNLESTGLLPFFDVLVTGDMVTHGKPNPETFLTAAALLGVDPAFCMGVEDSFNGVRAIRAAGMTTVMVPDMLTPTADIEALLDLKANTLWDILPFLGLASANQ